jgi:hypothetical protein
MATWGPIIVLMAPHPSTGYTVAFAMPRWSPKPKWLRKKKNSKAKSRTRQQTRLPLVDCGDAQHVPHVRLYARDHARGVSNGKWITLSCAEMLPEPRSGFRAGCQPDSSRGNIKIGPPADLRSAGMADFKAFQTRIRRHPARATDLQPGGIIA